MSDHTSKNFDLELESLRTRVLQMGGMAEQQVLKAIEGLYSGNLPLLETVIRDDERINQMEIEIDALCNQVIAKRQPTAIDLRMVVSVLKAISDIERVGDKARKIARLGISLAKQPGNLNIELSHMAEIALRMLRLALDGFARLDLKLVSEAIHLDSQVNTEYQSVTRQLITYMMEDPRTISASLDLLFLAKAIERGTRFVGLSDFTALQTALLTKTATQPAVTWAGNLLIDDWGQITEPDEITEACFSEMVQGSSEGAGWIISKKEQPETGTALLKKPVKNATLWGGNLCVLTSLLGTPYFPSIKKGVLFLEDVSEHPYRIERMLTQLLHAGVLDNQQAVILGQFTDFQTSTHDKGFNLRTVVQWLRSQTRTPILTGLPHGHVPTKVLLPVGATVDLQMQGRECLILWGHI